MMLIAALMTGMGLTCLLLRRTLLGALIGLQLMMLGTTVVFVSTDRLTEGHVFGLFIALSAVAQLVGGFAIAVRLFVQRRRTGMDELRTLKH